MPLIKLNISNMFLVVYVTLQLCKFLFSPNIPCASSKKLTYLNKFFLTHCNRFFTKTFLPQFRITWYIPWHYQISCFQTDNKYSENDSMTGELYKSVYQKTLKRLQTQYFRKLRAESQTGWTQISVLSSPSSNKFLVLAVKNYTESDCKILYSSPVLLDFFT